MDGIDREQEPISSHRLCDKVANKHPRPGYNPWPAFVGHPIVWGRVSAWLLLHAVIK